MYDLKASKKNKAAPASVNKTGIPSQLKENIEQSHNVSLDNVRIHYNSGKPQELCAYAYTQGSHVYISPGQEKYLPHELGHVVQQMRGKVRPAMQIKGVNINNDSTLEREADMLGRCQLHTNDSSAENIGQNNIVQCYYHSDANLINEFLQDNDRTYPTKLNEYNEKMNLLGIINGNIEISGHDDTYILYENGSPTLFSSAKELCFFLISRIRNENKAEVEQIKADVPFGNEFTFRSSTFGFDISSLSLKNNSMIQAVGKNIERWSEIAPQKIRAGSLSFAKEVRDGNKKWSVAPYNAKMIIYKSYDKESKTEVIWSFNIDLDPFCIEIQTQPITYNMFKILQPLYDMAIFNTAQTLGLFPDPNPDTGGGGHISLDKTGAFQNNAHYLRNFLVLYVNEQLNPTSPVHQCGDYINAPFLHELSCELGKNVGNDFINAIALFDRLPPERQTIDNLVDIIQKKVYHGKFMPQLETAIRAQEKIKENKKLNPEIAYHYQAVNLEHMRKTDSTAHIEMRRYNAQQNTYELDEQLKYLWSLLLLSRQKQDINLT